ncbi:MAG: hypothetical protein F4Z29_00845 [Gemmatimonadetes bacterium]|nr:hypothetical protein [Gemmatimonadota bacterium]
MTGGAAPDAEGRDGHTETVSLVEALRVDVGRGRMHTPMTADPELIAAETGITELQARAGMLAALLWGRTTVYGDVSISPLRRVARSAHREALRRAGLVE